MGRRVTLPGLGWPCPPGMAARPALPRTRSLAGTAPLERLSSTLRGRLLFAVWTPVFSHFSPAAQLPIYLSPFMFPVL